MEASGGIGSIGTYDLKLSAGVASVSIGAQVDICAQILAAAEKVSNATEKAVLVEAAAILKLIP
jgi:hypothetical protein